jgi:hypothetical protein
VDLAQQGIAEIAELQDEAVNVALP